jgi:hypothetical protein
MRCTSGRAIRPEERNDPCGRTLTVLRDPRTGNDIKLCPACDGLAGALASRPVKPEWEPPEAAAA